MLIKFLSKENVSILVLNSLISFGYIIMGNTVQAADDDYKDLLPEATIDASLIRASLSCFQNPLQQIAVTAYASDVDIYQDSVKTENGVLRKGLLSLFVLPLNEQSRVGSEDFLRLSSFVGPLPSEIERNAEVDELNEQLRRAILEGNDVLGIDQ